MQQHTVPKCYLKAWLEPVTPTGQKAAIWRIPVPHRQPGTPYRKSPEKSFTVSDRYTIILTDGTKSLHVEQTLGRLESAYAEVLQHIQRGEVLTKQQKLWLAAFTAAMLGRSEKQTSHWESQQLKMVEKLESIEREVGVVNGHSIEMRDGLKNARPDMVRWTIEIATPILVQMHLSILTTDDELGFITSDAPAFMYNPQAHKLPPFYRSPGLKQEEIEVTLPVTPQHMLLYRHNDKVRPRLAVPRNIVDEANRNQVWAAGEEIVSWKGLTRPEWFEKRDPPPDAWENTLEGKAAAKQQNDLESTVEDQEGS